MSQDAGTIDLSTVTPARPLEGLWDCVLWEPPAAALEQADVAVQVV